MKKIFFIPIGSFEQHGPHLPPETDYLIAKKITKAIAKDFSKKILKGIKIGISTEHIEFNMTRSITPEIFISKIKKVISKIGKKSILIIINAHGGNIETLKEIQHLFQNQIIILNTFSLIKESLKQYRTSEIGGICHAGEFETSLMMYLYPKKVKIQNLKKKDIVYVPSLDPNFENEKPKDWKTIQFSKSGVLGDPLHANKRKGNIWFENIVKNALKKIKLSFR
ncbi:MAG: creatininase family protein [Candidatus Lokiarchaeota archaeon]|nr:creatininase family protein [Candidatus Lokiarchaeota archaeon]